MLTSQDVLTLAAERWERGTYDDQEWTAVTVGEYRCTGKSQDSCRVSIHVHVRDGRGETHAACEAIGESRGPGANWDEAWAKAQVRPDAVIAESFYVMRLKAQQADARAREQAEASGG